MTAMKMKTTLFASLLLLSLLLVPAVFAEHQPFKPCCADGSSPWASESGDAFKSNARAGFQGSELPPNSGYYPDHLDRYDNPMNSIYRRDEQRGQTGEDPGLQERAAQRAIGPPSLPFVSPNLVP